MLKKDDMQCVAAVILVAVGMVVILTLTGAQIPSNNQLSTIAPELTLVSSRFYVYEPGTNIIHICSDGVMPQGPVRVLCGKIVSGRLSRDLTLKSRHSGYRRCPECFGKEDMSHGCDSDKG